MVILDDDDDDDDDKRRRTTIIVMLGFSIARLRYRFSEAKSAVSECFTRQGAPPNMVHSW